MIDTNSSPHVCVVKDPPFNYGGQCWCKPRKLVAAVRDISAVHDLPIWVWDDLLLPKASVVSLAAKRRAMRRAG